MTNSGLNGPYLLKRETIIETFSGKGPGAYILGSLNTNGGIGVRYVGRSDDDLIVRLCQHAALGKYTHFKASFLSSAAAAYRKECAMFHTFGELSLDNEIHPACPLYLHPSGLRLLALDLGLIDHERAQIA